MKILFAIFCLCVATVAQAQNASSKLAYADYKKEMGFSVWAGIAQGSVDGRIHYSVTLREPFNEYFGVMAVLKPGKEILARFPLYQFENEVRGRKEFTFECELVPEIAKDAKLQFCLFPKTDKERFYTVDLATWPVVIARKGGDHRTVPFEEVPKHLKVEKAGQENSPKAKESPLPVER
jgi:hypothetical protein